MLLPVSRRGSAGLEAVDLAAMAGLILDDWQAWCLDHAMAEQPDKRWSAFEVAIVVSRQAGKGSILEARQIAGLFLLGERLQVHTAHEFKTCFEHFLRVVHLVESTPELDRKVMRIRRGAGEQAIELKNGCRLRFLARSGGSGRGMSGDAVYLDEAFALTAPMMGALLPTLSARPNPQVWYTSSAPMSTSTVLHGVRDRGHEGKPGRLFFAEWACDRGADVEDRDNWYRANPGLGIRITEEFVAAELDAMRAMPDEFARERLGIPDPLPSTAGPPAKLDAAAWARTWITPDRRPPVVAGECTIAYAYHDGYTSVVVGVGSLGRSHVECVEHRHGTGWLPAYLADKVAQHRPTAIGFDAGDGHAAALAAEIREVFEAQGLDPELVVPLPSGRYKAACAALADAVDRGTVTRSNVGPADPLGVAGEVAAERIVGDAWLWDRKSAKATVSPLIAASIARALLGEQATESDAEPFVMFS